MSLPTFAIVAHCVYVNGVRLDQRMHRVESDEANVPTLPNHYVATIVESVGDLRTVLGAVVFRSDASIDHPRMGAFVRSVIGTVPELEAMLEEEDRSVVLVSFDVRRPEQLLDERDCRELFVRQYAEQTVAGTA